jgi:hypothetical protein
MSSRSQPHAYGQAGAAQPQPARRHTGGERGLTPQFFLPYGKKDGSSGWLKHNRQVRRGETSFKVWAPIKRRPTEEQAAEWEAAGRTVRRDPDGRPAVQVVGFRLTSTFDPLSRECCP